jgi:hypothetical protein
MTLLERVEIIMEKHIDLKQALRRSLELEEALNGPTMTHAEAHRIALSASRYIIYRTWDHDACTLLTSAASLLSFSPKITQDEIDANYEYSEKWERGAE